MNTRPRPPIAESYQARVFNRAQRRRADAVARRRTYRKTIKDLHAHFDNNCRVDFSSAQDAHEVSE